MIGVEEPDERDVFRMRPRRHARDGLIMGRRNQRGSVSMFTHRGRGGCRSHLLQLCQWYPLVFSHVPLPSGAFACTAALPSPFPVPGTGEVVGVDRGVAVSAALSTGELLHVPRLSPGRQRRLVLLQRRLARSQPGSRHRKITRRAIARLKAGEADARKDWCEKVSTDLARWFDVIRVEDLRIQGTARSAKGTVGQPGRNVAAKAGLNREIMRSGWGLLVRRLEAKAVTSAYTSQRCSGCGYIAAGNRKSQAVFACLACAATLNADVNAARNIAAGHAVTARGRPGLPGRANREPHLPLLSA